MSVRAYISLGSNVGDRRATLETALERLVPRRVSTIVETEPWGRAGQPRFLNAVAEVETDLGSEALLDRLLGVEQDLGRVRAERWGPRTLDLDLLLYGELVIRTARLAVPHPRLAQRRFVLEGLAELCPEKRVPGLDRTVRELLDLGPELPPGGAP
jgi:2-amino-4-hydroxy-6-hydroxymethyldihydropteridine diphosphokinase